jgi:hypothetical protein
MSLLALQLLAAYGVWSAGADSYESYQNYRMDQELSLSTERELLRSQVKFLKRRLAKGGQDAADAGDSISDQFKLLKR